MKKTVPLLLSALVAAACSSHDESSYYQRNYNPNKVVTSMITLPLSSVTTDGYFMYGGDGTGPNGVINMAAFQYPVDLNEDRGVDFKFIVRHEFVSESAPPEDKNKFVIYLAATDEGQVSMADADYGYIRKYSKGELLDAASFGTNFRFNLNEPGSFIIKQDADDDFVTSGEFYVAVKQMINGKAHYGWVLIEPQLADLTLKIKGYALSRTPDKPISAGEEDK